MEELLKKIMPQNINYAVVCGEAYSYIVMYLAYSPCEYTEDSTVGWTDSYFEAYQTVRGVKLSVMDTLAQNGFSVGDCSDASYKTLAAQTGKAVLLKNTLAAFENCGSFAVMEVIRIAGSYGNEPCEVKHNALCENCRLCEKACPTGAAGADGFCMEKCLRNVQVNAEFDNDYFMRAMGTRIIGCNTCQSVCPVNKNILKRKQNETEQRLFNMHNLFYNCLNGKKAMAEYENILGKNYVRPVRLLVMAINSMRNAGDCSLADDVKKLLVHNDVRVRTAAERYLNETER